MKICHLFIIVQIAWVAVSCDSKAKDNSLSIEGKAKISGQAVIDELEELEFFNLTDKDKIEAAKNDMIESYEKHHYFGGLTYKDSMVFVDHRFFSIDHEEFFEYGGLTTYLDNVKSTFRLLGLKLDCKNESEVSYEDNSWNHTIELNGIVYTAFEGKMNENSWGMAIVNFARMLNDQLKRQNSNDQVHLINGGNDGMIVFLTPEMHELVLGNYPDDYNRPMTIDQWKKYNDLK